MKNIFSRFIMLVLIVFTFQSCYLSLITPKEHQWYQFKYKKPDKNGVVFGTFTLPDTIKKYDYYFLNFMSLDTNPKIVKRKSIFPYSVLQNRDVYTAHPHQGEIDNGKTYLFILEIAEGKYEIPKLDLQYISRSAFLYWNRSLEISNFSIPLDVKKGEIKYIGNIFFDENNPTKDSAVKISDNYQRDLGEIKKYVSNLDWSNVKNDSEKKIIYKK